LATYRNKNFPKFREVGHTNSSTRYNPKSGFNVLNTILEILRINNKYIQKITSNLLHFMSTMRRTEKRSVSSTLLFLGDGTREQTDSKSSVKMNQKDDNTFPLFQPRIYCRVTCDDRTSTCHLFLFVLRRLDCISYWRTRLKVQ
jgi:hypothetical protein